jgi:predicted site-specific integrase-resolvase
VLIADILRGDEMKQQELSLDLDTLTDTEGASNLLAIPTATLIKWRSTGEVRIPYVRIGRQIKYRTKDLKAFIEISTVK